MHQLNTNGGYVTLATLARGRLKALETSMRLGYVHRRFTGVAAAATKSASGDAELASRALCKPTQFSLTHYTSADYYLQ